jgi:hypothetical protein
MGWPVVSVSKLRHHLVRYTLELDASVVDISTFSLSIGTSM